MNSNATLRVRAGLYISADGQIRIQRRRDMKRRAWVWECWALTEKGELGVLLRTFRTLRVAREWVGAITTRAF